MVYCCLQEHVDAVGYVKGLTSLTGSPAGWLAGCGCSGHAIRHVHNYRGDLESLQAHLKVVWVIGVCNDRPGD